MPLLIQFRQGPLPVAEGGTGSTNPSLIGGANVDITGAWPNQVISLAGELSAYYQTVQSVGVAKPQEDVLNFLAPFSVADNPSNGSTDVSLPTTGSGSVVLASGPTITSATLVTPALGTPTSGNLTNCTFPTLNQNTTGTAGGLSGSPSITVTTLSATTINGAALSGTFTGTPTFTGTLTIGSGGSVATSGSGILDANQISGVTVSATAPVTGQSLVATGSNTAAWQTVVNQIPLPSPFVANQFLVTGTPTPLLRQGFTTGIVSTGTSPLILSITLTVTGGDALIVGARATGLSGAPSISDNNGNAYTLVANINNDWLWVAPDANAGSTTVEVQGSFTGASATGEMHLGEFLGPLTVSPTDATGTTFITPNNTNASVTTSKIISSSNELVIGFFSATNGTPTPGAGYTQVVAPGVSSGTLMEYAFVQNGEGTTQTATQTTSPAAMWNCIIATFVLQTNYTWRDIVASDLPSFSGGDLSGSYAVPQVVSTHLSSPLPVNQGGTGTATPSLVGGTNVTISGSWPNQTVNATTSGGVTTLNSLTGVISITGTGITVTSGPLGSPAVETINLSLPTSGVTPNSYTLANITVNAEGIITAASSSSTTGSGSVVLATNPTITVGTGGSIGFSGTGVINANELYGVVISSTAPTSGQILVATSGSAAAWQTVATGSGTVNTGTATQIAYYTASTNVVSGDPNLTDSGTVLTYTGTGGMTLGLTSYTTGVNNSPSCIWGGSYESSASGPTYAQDSWTVQNVVGPGLHGTSFLTFTHAGTTGETAVVLPATTSLIFGTDLILSRPAAGVLDIGSLASGSPPNTGATLQVNAILSTVSVTSASLIGTSNIIIGSGTSNNGVQLGWNTGIPVSGVTGQLFGIANPLVAWELALDNNGNLGVAGGIHSGSAGSVSGVITLQGSTSGSCTITAPATAGTTTNAITVSNSIQIPSGTVYAISTDTGISRASAGVLDVGNGSAGNASGTVNAAQYNVAGSQISAANLSNGTTGTGSIVLAAGPTLTGTTTVATLAATTFSGNPNFSGTPTFANAVALGSSTATTQTAGTNNTTIATTAFVATSFAPLASPTFTGTLTCATLSPTTLNGCALSGTFTGTPTLTGTLTVGTGGALTFSGTGVINANELYGVVISSTAPTSGQILVATSGTTANWQTVATGSGTVSSATATQIAYYSSTGSVVSGDTNLTDTGTVLTYFGTGGIATGLSSYTTGINNSPSITLAGSYESSATGPTYAQDSWTVQNVVGPGLHGTSFLTFTHSGTPGETAVVLPATTSLIFGTDVILSRKSTGVLDVGSLASGSPPNTGGTVNAGQYNVNGSQIAASNLSNGTTGTGAVVLQNAPTITGTLTTAGISASGSLAMASGQPISWNSDTGFSRNAAGIVYVGNGNQNDSSGTLLASSVVGTTNFIIGTGAANSGCQIGYNTGVNVGGVITRLFGIANPAVAWNLALDESGNFGIAGNYYNGGSAGTTHASTAITAITLSGGIVTAITTSDERLKKNIVAFTKGLDAVLNIKPITFEWDSEKTPMKSDHPWTGFSAQQVSETLPESSWPVPDDKNGDAQVENLVDFNVQVVVAALVNSIKELNARIQFLEAKLGNA